MISFDILLESIGGIGKYQILLYFLVSYGNILFGFNSLITVFIAYAPDKRCSVPPLDNCTAYPNLTESDILNYTTPYNGINQKYDTCLRYGYDLSTCNGDLTCVNQTYPAINCDHGYYYDRSLFTETIITEFDLVCDRNYLNALSTSIFYCGMLVGSFMFGNTADRFGRKTTMIVTYAGTIACMFGVTYSFSVEMYMIFRTLTAVFLFGSSMATFVYIMEMLGSKWRTILGMSYQGFFTIGYMALSGVAYNWRNWHDIMLVSTLLSLPILLVTIFIPESPRWQFTKGKDEPAIKTTNKMAKFNGIMLTENDWDRAKKDHKNIKTTKSSQKYSTIDLFRTSGIRLTTFKVMFNWFSNSLVYYGVSLNAGSLAGDIFLNNALGGVMELSSYFFCMLIMDRVGRRLILCVMILVSGVGLISSVLVNEYKGDDKGLETLGLVFAFIAKFAVSGSFAVLYNFTTEIYPTVVRSNGVGMGSVSARIAGILAPFIISLQDYVDWLPNAIFGILGVKSTNLNYNEFASVSHRLNISYQINLPVNYEVITFIHPAVVTGIVSLTFPETNGHRMMETIEEAELFYKTKKIIPEFEYSDSESGKEDCKKSNDILPAVNSSSQVFSQL